jgi:uncharacterized protein YeeX (DUF496 family)
MGCSSNNKEYKKMIDNKKLAILMRNLLRYIKLDQKIKHVDVFFWVYFYGYFYGVFD